MKRLKLWLMFIVTFVFALPTTAQEASISEISITATVRTFVLDEPRANAELVGILQSGVELSALGRNGDGEWLRIMDGWVLGEVFNTVGEVGALPDATHSFRGSAAAHTFLYSGPSERWFDSLAGMGEGTPLLIVGRNKDSTWLQVPGGWVEAAQVETGGDVSLLPVTPSGVIITAKTRTFILAEPDLSAEFVDVFEARDEALAIGREGDWLRIAQGWVSAEAVELSGDASRFPFAGDGIVISMNTAKSIRRSPGAVLTLVGELMPHTKALVIGRNSDGSWLKLSTDGWITNSGIESAIDIMNLPVPEEASRSNSISRSSSTTSATRAETTQVVSSASTIRSLVSRHTEDIRILDIETAANATTIEYDLKPWPFVPNEQIAEEVAFKIICAIRNGQQIPNTLKLIGHGHFKSDIGRKFKSPSVEIHITARNANRLICRGNSYTDINWRSVSVTYNSYPIPRGASVDYD